MQGPEFLQTLVNQTLCYGIKSPDMDLYDFGFSNRVLDFDKDAKEAYAHFLHVVCRFKVIWRRGKRRIVIYDEDTPSEKFQTECSRLVGLNVRCALLSEKNDLWLDFGDCWVVFATFENGEESWRLFTPKVEGPCLVASDAWLDFSDYTGKQLQLY